MPSRPHFAFSRSQGKFQNKQTVEGVKKRVGGKGGLVCALGMAGETRATYNNSGEEFRVLSINSHSSSIKGLKRGLRCSFKKRTAFRVTSRGRQRALRRTGRRLRGRSAAPTRTPQMPSPRRRRRQGGRQGFGPHGCALWHQLIVRD